MFFSHLYRHFRERHTIGGLKGNKTIDTLESRFKTRRPNKLQVRTDYAVKVNIKTTIFSKKLHQQTFKNIL
jgi:hypothetical protein